VAKGKLEPAPRLPKEPSPHGVRSFGPRPSFDALPAPDPSAPPIVTPSPSAYRQENPDNPPPAEYKPPSMLAEYKGLAILFAAVCVAFAFYCLRAPRAPSALTAAPRAAQAASSAAASAPAGHAPAGQAPVRQAPAANAAPAAVQPKQPIYVETLPET
jgi:hypothetical protein